MLSRIAVMDQSSAPVSAGGSLALCRFQATRQRAEQNRACSRRGANERAALLADLGISHHNPCYA